MPVDNIKKVPWRYSQGTFTPYPPLHIFAKIATLAIAEMLKGAHGRVSHAIIFGQLFELLSVIIKQVSEKHAIILFFTFERSTIRGNFQ